MIDAIKEWLNKGNVALMLVRPVDGQVVHIK